MREPKCNTCRNARMIISENVPRYACTLSGVKPLRCMANDDYYKPIIGPNDFENNRSFEDALRKAIKKFERKT